MNDQNQHCPICNSSDLAPIVTIENLPVFCNVLFSEEAGARSAPRGTLDLRFCRHCSHVYNFAFEPAAVDYEPSYENALHFSPLFRKYADELAERLVKTYELKGKTGIEIGCGDGYFLNLLCTHGLDTGIGFDPSLPEKVLADDANRLSFIRDYYSQEYNNIKADILCLRHVLEHVPFTASFVSTLTEAAREQEIRVLYCEVPNGLFSFEENGFWDLIYEHCSYFNADSLRYLFARSGFHALQVNTDFGNQFLSIEAGPATAEATPPQLPEQRFSKYESFADRFESTVQKWDQKLQQWHGEGRSVAIWGAGSKGATFLNIADRHRTVSWAIDINERKTGKYIPGSAQRIIAPSALPSVSPDVILVMNPNYVDEIRAQLASAGLSTEVTVVQ